MPSLLFSSLSIALCGYAMTAVAATAIAAEAVDFARREVYRAEQTPAYTSWVSLFPGDRDEWYLSFEEVRPSDPPLPRATLDQWYRMALPDGYDKSSYHMEVVLLKSSDQCATWSEVSRQPVRFQHSSSPFAQVRTRDGRFLRGLWTCYSLEEPQQPGRFLFESTDDGATWKRLPPLLDDRLCAHPHRMKQLRDGTIVLAVPYGLMWGPDKLIPVRTAKPPYAIENLRMSLFVSHDEGRTWDGPIALFPGRNISETDFVELPSGDLLAFVNSIFGQAGRQIVHRVGDRFVPGLYESIPHQTVPECMTLTDDGVLVGAMRNGPYSWSDDEGRTWQPLKGTQSCGYQPMIRQMADGRIICAWHRGADDPIASADQFIGLDLFRLQVDRRTVKTNLALERCFDPGQNRFLNEYEATLTADGVPVPNKRVTLWYAVQGQPGYEPFNRGVLPERMSLGGKTIEATSDAQGVARLAIPEANLSAARHYQVAAVFNADRSDPDHLPAASAICGFHSSSHGNDPAKSPKSP